ncbi:breast cancer anti-estrogen resistance protein 1 [Rhopalosiphum maidis]|uniref:breast cancer anti-estrogen resistance protein 1 n=1 Tax=Rhopalosiphum maidis TaxID=43146 RepID=UPI000EFFC515|nr:breast cancer anti-estrogen resistance protein 1 [Rhopalosiphum maidis]
MLQLHQNGSTNNGYTNCIARAMYDNIAEAPDELAFRKDDILTVLEQNTAGLEGWWLCSLRGRQGICPGNRLRLIPGVYEVTEPQIISNCIQDKNHFIHESKHQSWHGNLNTVTSQQTLGDLLTYDTPQKTIDSNGYNIPPTNHTLDRLTNDFAKRPLSIGSSSGCCSDSYDPLPNQHPLVLKESYDVPRPLNIQVTPSSSISSLSTGGICSSTSGSESNRSSSIGLDYDVPRNRTLVSLPSELQNLTISSQDYDVPSNNLQPKELSIDLNCALDCLDKLTSEVSSNTTQLLNYAGPNWRNQKNLEANLVDIKIISLRLKNSLRQFIEFSEGCLGNAINACDKGISTKLHPLVFDLIKTDKMICYSTNALDCLDWKPRVLYRDLNNECEYSEDALDKLISCAKLLTDDIRQVTSFIKGNSTLLFKKKIISDNDEEDDDYEYICDENGKKPNISSASIKNDNSSSEISTKDKNIYNYYSHQIDSQTDLLTSHINNFLQIVKENRPPPVFIMKVKYIILIAHQLVVVGDTICRNVQESTVKNHVEQCTKALSAGISAVVQKSKVATQLFPSVTAVQEMVDCVVEISHVVNDLKVSVLKTK